MQKNAISTKQTVCILVMFLFGNSLMYSGSKARQDTWLAILIAAALFIPLMLIYARILRLYPGKGFYDIVMAVFGGFFGRVATLIYLVYSLHIGAVLMRNFSEFIMVTALQETTQFISLIFLFGLAVWMTRSGIVVLGKWSGIALPVVIAAIIMTLLISIGSMNFDYLRPIGGSGRAVILDSSLTLLSFPFAESVIFPVVFGSVEEKGSPYKIYAYGLLISALFFCAASLRNTLVLGPSAAMFFFPSYEAVSVISLGEFFSRIEVLIGIAFLIDVYVKLCVFMTSAAMGASKLFCIPEYRNIAAPVGLLMLTLAAILYENIVEMYDWIEVYKYYAFPLQIILPVIILIVAEIRTRSKEKQPAGMAVK